MDRIIWTQKQISRFFTEAPAIDLLWSRVCKLAYLTGLRAGELYALQWGDVDLDEKTLYVHNAYNHKTKVYQKHTKTGVNRHIPVGGQLREIIADFSRITYGELPFVLPRLSAFDNGNQSMATQKICMALHLPAIRFHDFRALYASQLLINGVSLAIVMQICGWTQLSTAQRYLRLSGRDILGAIDQVEFTL